MTRKLQFLALQDPPRGKGRRKHPFRFGASAEPGRTSRPLGAAILACLSALGTGSDATAEDILAGPVPAVVEGVIDGDTLKVRAHIWLDQNVAIHVRLAGVDAPEMSGACDRETALAERAREFLQGRLPSAGDNGPNVQLLEVRYGKYARRVVARVETEAGLDLGAALLAAGLAQPYNGGRRPTWCD